MYTAGYITRKTYKKFPNSNRNLKKTHSKWISMKSRGFLTYPEASLLVRMKGYDESFNSFHGKKINMEVDPIGELLKIILPQKCSKIRRYEVKLYINIRFFGRIKELNKNLQISKEEKKKNSREKKQKKQFSN